MTRLWGGAACPSAGRRTLGEPMDAVDRASALRAYADETASCERCTLAAGRTQVVFGAGKPDADLMLVGDAPGFHEDARGVPFVGQAGALLDRLLAGIGLERSEVYLANLLKCRPPGNRDPLPDEIASCEGHLFRQIELVGPTVVATLGNVATKLLSGSPHGITHVHGQERTVALGTSRVVLYPLYHPAAALYTPSMLEVLERDFGRIPGLLAQHEPALQDTSHAGPECFPTAVGEAETVQLGLF